MHNEQLLTKNAFAFVSVESFTIKLSQIERCLHKIEQFLLHLHGCSAEGHGNACGNITVKMIKYIFLSVPLQSARSELHAITADVRDNGGYCVTRPLHNR